MFPGEIFPKPTAIVLDTSVIYGDFRLRSRDLQQVLRLASAVGIKVWITEVTVGELIAHYRRDLESISRDYRKAIDDLGRVTFEGGQPENSVDEQNLHARYEIWLRKEIDILSVGLVPVTTRPNSELVARAHSQRRPFDGKDFGYKDTLIWLSLLDDLVPNLDRLILVSNDRDFGDDQGLYQDLKNDLAQSNEDAEKVDLVRNLKSTIDLLNSEFDAVKAIEIADAVDEFERVSREAAPEDVAQIIYDSFSSMDFTDDLVFLLESRPDLLTSGFRPHPNYVSNASEDIEFKTFEFSYFGNGVWRFEADAEWYVLVSYTDDEGWDPSYEYEDNLMLQLSVTGYVDVVSNELENINFELENV